MNIRAGFNVGPIMRTLILLLLTLFFLPGCTYETNEAPEDDMNDRARSTPEQWGQEKVFKSGTWKLKQIRSVLTRDTPKIFVPPQTSTIIAGIVNEDSDVVQDYTLRWVLRPGTGGARTEVRFDATGFTRVSLPLEAFTLGLVIDPDDPDDPDFPVGDVEAFAFVGEGGVGTDEAEGPQFTQVAHVPAGGDLVVQLPVGATALRLTGNSGITGDPFATATQLQIRRGISVLGILPGLGALVGDPSLWTLFASGAWLPIPGSATNIKIHNGGVGAIVGRLMFKLDL